MIHVLLHWEDRSDGSDLVVAKTRTLLARVSWVRHEGNADRLWYAIRESGQRAPIINAATSREAAKEATEAYFGVLATTKETKP